MKNTYFNTIFAISALVFHVSMQAMKMDDTSMIDNVIITQEGTYDEYGNFTEDKNNKIIAKIRDRIENFGKVPNTENVERYYAINKDRIHINYRDFFDQLAQFGADEVPHRRSRHYH